MRGRQELEEGGEKKVRYVSTCKEHLNAGEILKAQATLAALILIVYILRPQLFTSG